ncbi:MAG: CAP domain-containing protein [Myxococcales bacterium]
MRRFLGVVLALGLGLSCGEGDVLLALPDSGVLLPDGGVVHEGQDSGHGQISDAGSFPELDGGCQPRSCADLGAACGTVDDGCGRTVECGGCAVPETCGGGGVAHQCGVPAGHREEQTLSGATGDEGDGLIPVCCAPSELERLDIEEVFRLLNEHRQANGRAPLTYDYALEAAIEGHCHHMAVHTFFDHAAPEEAVSSPWTRASLCGTSANGENIAAGQRSPAAVMEAWKNSSGHNANMLNPAFKRVGIGSYVGGPYGIYWGQLFGN